MHIVSEFLSLRFECITIQKEILQDSKKDEKTINIPKQRDISPNVFPFILLTFGVALGVIGIVHENSNFISFGVCSTFWAILLFLHLAEKSIS